MTDQALHDAILADLTAKALADAGNDSGVAARMVAILPLVTVTTFLDEAAVIRVLGATEGDTTLASIEAASVQAANPYASLLTRIVRILRVGSTGGIDFGDPQTQGMLDTLQGAGVLTADAVTKIKAACHAPQTVAVDQVSRCLYSYRHGGV